MKEKNPLLIHIPYIKRLKRENLEERYAKCLKMFAGHIAATQEWVDDKTMDKIYDTWCDICKVEQE